MIFTITRTSTSGLSANDSPCPGTTKRTIERDVHGRQWSYDIWELELNSLEELMALQEAQGSLVLSSASIEIYDDYRE